MSSRRAPKGRIVSVALLPEVSETGTNSLRSIPHVSNTHRWGPCVRACRDLRVTRATPAEKYVEDARNYFRLLWSRPPLYDRYINQTNTTRKIRFFILIFFNDLASTRVTLNIPPLLKNKMNDSSTARAVFLKV